MGKGKKIALTITILIVLFLVVSFPIPSYTNSIDLSGLTKFEDTFSVYPFRDKAKIYANYTLSGVVNITIIDPNNKTVYTVKLSGTGGRDYLLDVFSVGAWGKYKIVIYLLGTFDATIKITAYNRVLASIS